MMCFLQYCNYYIFDSEEIKQHIFMKPVKCAINNKPTENIS